MNRKVSGPRRAYVKTFNEWMNKHGAKIEGVEIADYEKEGECARIDSLNPNTLSPQCTTLFTTFLCSPKIVLFE